MSKKELEILLSEATGPCISIIVPSHRVSPDRIIDSGILQKAAKQAKELMEMQYISSPFKNEIISKLDDLISTIDFVHLKEGIGIFVSAQYAQIVKFPFPVIYKVKVGESFDNRDLLYNINAILDYCVLTISKKQIRMFTATGEELQEINNEDFPLQYEEQYEYARSSRGNSYGYTLKDFERDKSVLQEIRLIDMLRTADHSLSKYINTHIPLIVSGGKKEINDFVQTTQFPKRVIGKVAGNYNFNGAVQLSNLAWTEAQNYIRNQNKITLTKLRELVGKSMAVFGIEEVWKAAMEGKGLQLLVEKDFECHAFVKATDNYELKLKNPSSNKKYVYTNDVIEKTIKIVRQKGGKVTFVDNGEMSDFNGIALQLRYNNLSQV